MATPTYGLHIGDNLDEIYPKGEDYTCNGVCSQCGNCCTHHLRLSPQEITHIRRYIKKHNIKPQHHGTPSETNPSVDLLCPFLKEKDDGTTECTIYEVRPLICKAYRCNRNFHEIAEICQQELNNKHLSSSTFFHTHDETNMQQTFFPRIFTPRANDAVIINQVHMIEHLKHQNTIFLHTGITRQQNQRTEILLKRSPDDDGIWFDEKGLALVETPDTRKRK